MRNFSRTLITLPVFAVPLLVGGLKPALALSVTPLEAVQLLAEAKAANARCHHLDEAGRQDLAELAAVAEIAAVQRTGIEDARGAVAAGRSAGEKGRCGSDRRAAIDAALAAAREASAAAAKRTEPRMPVRLAAKSRPGSGAMPLPAAEVRRLGKGGLAGYSRLAVAYYIERRCRHLARKGARTFWSHIVRRHAAMLAANPGSKVAAAQRGAAAKADGQACGARTASLVRSAFAEIKGL